MEAVELVVYIAVAVLIGGMILFVTQEMANPDSFKKIKNILSQEKEITFQEVNKEALSEFIFAVWEECDQGLSNFTVTIQYTGSDATKEEVFFDIKRLRLCNTLSSQEQGCGSREDLSINTQSETVTPGIRTLTCDNVVEKLIIQ